MFEIKNLKNSRKKNCAYKSKLSNDECHFFANGLFTEKIISHSDGSPYHQPFLNINHIWEQLFECNPPDLFEFTPGATFCVSRNQIQKRNKEFYCKKALQP